MNSIRWTVFPLYSTSGEQHQVNSISSIFNIRWTTSSEHYFTYIPHQVNSIRWIVFHLYSWQKSSQKVAGRGQKRKKHIGNFHKKINCYNTDMLIESGTVIGIWAEHFGKHKDGMTWWTMLPCDRQLATTPDKLLLPRGFCKSSFTRAIRVSKGVIRICKSKNRHHNGQKKMDKRPNTDLQNIQIIIKIE